MSVAALVRNKLYIYKELISWQFTSDRHFYQIMADLK